jgi:hypothetical protein
MFMIFALSGPKSDASFSGLACKRGLIKLYPPWPVSLKEQLELTLPLSPVTSFAAMVDAAALVG